MSAAFPHGGQHCNRDSQLQGTGKVHHQHRQHLGHIPCYQIGQGRTAEGVRNQFVGHSGGFIFGSGFQLFRFFNHANHPVITTASGSLLHNDDASAFFHNGSGVHGTSRTLGSRHGLSGERRLVHHGLPFKHFAVQRNHTAGTNHDAVAGTDFSDVGEHLRIFFLQPDLIHV